MGKLSDRIRRFMMGRRGNDQLSIALFIAYIVFIVLSRLFWKLYAVRSILNLIGLSCAVYGIYRSLSRNIAARERENAWFMKHFASVRRVFMRYSRRIRDRKTHVYVKCTGCGAELRVPRGKGKLIVTCPKCRSEIRVTT